MNRGKSIANGESSFGKRKRKGGAKRKTKMLRRALARRRLEERAEHEVLQRHIYDVFADET